ncbi:lecithin retinol acyltransferase family protein [Psychrobacter sp. M13]|uniref:lecithin retinol acyltransferase family protein n=1 Tax=Psychrobacter sp. M13 TaxID=3067275 RepID=UPI00273ADEDC|nr:lecithin retinol acyltransferase family protein [Psychrobacter sp. M13]WLP94761.1 lecithin retinol acyltransferase family protein [Psychrobacter sp. M13]
MLYFRSPIVELMKKVMNTDDDSELARGTVLRVELTKMGVVGFDHFGIYAGNNKVIHFSEKKIRKEPLSKFVEDAGWFNGNHVDVMSFSRKFVDYTSLEESYLRAKSCLGMTGYDLVDANCEHFALWCRMDEAFSGQAFGSNSKLFSKMGGTAVGALNIPRLVGKAFNKLEMEKSRSICIDNIIDI